MSMYEHDWGWDPRRSDSLIRGFRSVDADHC